MRDFILPFALSVPLAVPLLWYHLDGLDPLDVTSPAPSQTAIDFADTRDLIDSERESHMASPRSRLKVKDPSLKREAFNQSTEAASPGY